MQIDRARFLLLTASLAGGGCSSNPPSDPVAPPTPTETGPEVTVPETSTPSLTVAAPETTASAEPTTTSAPQPSPIASGPCDNDTGTVAACSLKAPPGPFCESFSDSREACKSFRTGLRGAVAAKAVDCLNAASGKQEICDWQTQEKCGMEAIRTACIQPSTFNQCSPVVSACAGQQWNKLTIEDCQRLLSSVKDGKRKAMITCMTEGCSIDSCMWSLR
jgi:hypothetical protein